MNRMIQTALGLTFLAAAAQAQDVVIDPAVDVNGDGLYSFVELSNLYPEFQAVTFTEIDADGDGLLNLEEVTAGAAAGLMPVPTE